MKIEKAIEKLKDLSRYAYEPETQQAEDALQLGIEAMKRINDWRAGKVLNPDFMLPGETE